MATAAPEHETKSLPTNAYQPLKEDELYVPLVPASINLPEVTWRAVSDPRALAYTSRTAVRTSR